MLGNVIGHHFELHQGLGGTPYAAISWVRGHRIQQHHGLGPSSAAISWVRALACASFPSVAAIVLSHIWLGGHEMHLHYV